MSGPSYTQPRIGDPASADPAARHADLEVEKSILEAKLVHLRREINEASVLVARRRREAEIRNAAVLRHEEHLSSVLVCNGERGNHRSSGVVRSPMSNVESHASLNGGLQYGVDRVSGLGGVGGGGDVKSGSVKCAPATVLLFEEEQSRTALQRLKVVESDIVELERMCQEQNARDRRAARRRRELHLAQQGGSTGPSSGRSPADDEYSIPLPQHCTDIATWCEALNLGTEDLLVSASPAGNEARQVGLGAHTPSSMEERTLWWYLRRHCPEAVVAFSVGGSSGS